VSRRTLGTVVALLGVLLLADAVLALTWREPVTAVLGDRAAAQLPARLEATTARLDRRLTGRIDAVVAPQARMALAARALAEQASPGDALGRITIPRIDARFTVVQGTAAADLRAGPGHYPSTALPGEHGTVGLAGHRTTYLQPFRHLDAMRRGDRVIVAMPYGRFTYVVSGSRVVAPSQVAVLARAAGAERLVLTACHPLFSAAQRLVVTARLAGATPLGPARAIS
jgi:sortase A